MHRTLIVTVLIITVLGHIAMAAGGQKRAKAVVLHEIARYPWAGGEPFTQVGDVATDRDGNVYVTDEYQWSVRKFSPNGAMLARYGRRGKLPGAFQSGPARIDCLNDTLAVIGMGSNRVQFFTREFQPIAEADLPGAILDLALLPDGSMAVATVQPPARADRTLTLYTKSGAEELPVPLVGQRRDPVLDMTCLARDRNGLLAVAYRFVNTVMVFDNHHMLLKSFSLPGLPASSGGEIAAGSFNGMPDELIRDIGFDERGNIFVLSGEFSAHPGRDVFVTDYHGTVRATVLLPDRTGLLYLDQRGNLFTREQKRTVVRKYRLEYRRF